MPERQTIERQHTVTKHPAEAYFIKHKRLYWGYFFIGKSTMAAHTDFGDWAFHWSAPDTDPKDFLISCDAEYILRKLTKRDHFDEERTRKVFFEQLRDMRREGRIAKGRARELHDELSNEPDDLIAWGMSQEEFQRADCYEWAVYDYPPEARAMMGELWPLFIEQLKAERAADTAPQEATA